MNKPSLLKSLPEFHNIFMAKTLENFQLSNRSFFNKIIIISFLKFFDGDKGVSIDTTGLEDNSISPLPNGIDYLVIVHINTVNNMENGK